MTWAMAIARAICAWVDGDPLIRFGCCNRVPRINHYDFVRFGFSRRIFPTFLKSRQGLDDSPCRAKSKDVIGVVEIISCVGVVSSAIQFPDFSVSLSNPSPEIRLAFQRLLQIGESYLHCWLYLIHKKGEVYWVRLSLSFYSTFVTSSNAWIPIDGNPFRINSFSFFITCSFEGGIHSAWVV